MIKINEIFFSIQGESSLMGWPTVFVRTTGCNLRCTYCDTKYSYEEGTYLSQEAILTEISKYSARHVCLTGGEPLLQKECWPLMTKLCDLGYTVSLETSGSKSCAAVDARVRIVLDVKPQTLGKGKLF